MTKYLNRLFFPILIAIALITTSCSGTKKAVRAPLKEYGEQYLIEKLKGAELKFDAIAAKFDVTYKYDRKKTNLSGTLRIAKDSTIWISISPALNIEALRFVLTPDSIKLINRINNTFLLRDFSYINQLLNKTLDYDMAQSFLLGNDFSLYETNSFKASIDNDLYKLSTTDRRKIRRFVRKSNDEISIPLQTIWLEPDSFKITKVLLKEAERDSRKFTAFYTNHVEVANQLFPSNLLFEVETDKEKISIKIAYSKISINQEQTYPFRIPEGYTEVQELKQKEE